MKGRKPKLASVKRLHGNPGRRPLPKNELEPERGVPEPPEWLSAAALRHWHTLVPELDAAGVLTTGDARALGLLCEVHAEWRAACAAIKRHGKTYTQITAAGKRTVLARPEVAMRSDAWKRYKSMLLEFGLTPTSRSRVSANPKREKSDFQKFLDGGPFHGTKE